MEFFSFTQILEFIKLEPGHGFLQSTLLFMIWWASKDIKKELIKVQTGLNDHMMKDENRFSQLERAIK